MNIEEPPQVGRYLPFNNWKRNTINFLECASKFSYHRDKTEENLNQLRVHSDSHLFTKTL